MDRRALLRTVSAVGTVGAFAGCLGGAGAPVDSSETDGPDPTTDRPETADGTETDGGTETPAADTAVVGDRSTVAFPDQNTPHSVTVTNVAEDPTTLDLTVSAEGRGEVWARTVELAAGGRLEIRLAEPGHYTVAVRRDADGGPDLDADVDVPLASFDCNGSGTQVEVTADGVDSTTVSTTMGCPAAELVGTSFDAGEGRCGNTDADAADVRYDGESIRVTGTVSLPTPCHEAALSEATYDDRESTLFLTVAVRDAGGVCVDCVGVRDYEATADFDVDLPDRVVVRHADEDETVEVTRAVRGGR